MHSHLKYFLNVLTSACADVGDRYYQLPQAHGDQVYRERVYCYELYHQMRCRWGEFPYSLGGEVDKAGHPAFRGGPYRHSKPDFLVHIPGDMEGNLAVVEVKASTASFEALRRDVRKLAWFCGEPAGYYCGVLLVYGTGGSFEESWPELQLSIEETGVERFALVRHTEIGGPASVIGTIGLAPFAADTE